MSPADEENPPAFTPGAGPTLGEGQEKRDPNNERAALITNLIIGEMCARIAKRGITPDDLRNAYKKNKEIEDWYRPTSGNKKLQPNPDELAFRTGNIATYDYLFGFTGEVRRYLPRNGKPARSPLTIRHIKTLDASLKLLSIYGENEAPPFDDNPATWVPFLEFVLGAITGQPVEKATAARTTPATNGLRSSDHEAAEAIEPPSPESKLDRDTEDRKAHPNSPVVSPAERVSNTGTVPPQTRRSRYRALKRVALGGLAFVLAGLVLLVLYMPRPAVGPAVSTAEFQVNTSAPANAPPPFTARGALVLPIDTKWLVGGNAGAENDDPSLLPSPEIDPRLEETSRLRRNGSGKEADQLALLVADEWLKTEGSRDKAEAKVQSQLGASAYFRHDIDDAILAFTKAVKLDASPQNLNDLGTAFLAKGHLSSAISTYTDAIRADEKFPPAYVNRGNAYLALSEPKSDLAISDYTTATTLNPRLVAAFNGLGNAFAAGQNYERAIREYHNAIRIDPNSARPYHGLGALYDSKGEIDKALENYGVALQLDRSFVRAWINRGISYLRSNDFQNAVDDLERGVGLANSSPKFDKAIVARAHTALGTAYSLTRRQKEARSEFDAAINLNPTAEAYAGRGAAHAAMFKLKDAFRDLDEAVRRSEYLVLARILRARLWLLQDKPGPAAQDLDVITGIARSEPFGYVGRGILFAYQGKSAEAAADFDAAEQLSSHAAVAAIPRSYKFLLTKLYDEAIGALSPVFSELAKPARIEPVGAYVMRAQAYLAQGKISLAVTDYSDALQIADDDPNLWIKRSDAFEKLGDSPQAIADLSKAINLDQENIVALINRAFIYERGHENDLARADYESAIRVKPDDPSLSMAYLGLGDIARDRDDLEKAVGYYGEVIEKFSDPNVYVAHARRAITLESMGKYGQSIADWSAAIRIRPWDTSTYSSRARAHRAVGDFGQAIADFTVRTKQEESNPEAWDDRGDTLYAAGRFAEAVQDYTRAINVRGASFYPYVDRGKAYEALQKYDLAIADYAAAIPQNSKPADAIARLFELRAKLDRKTAVKELELNAIKVDGADALFPVIELLQGRRTADAVLAVSGDYKCIVQYHVAQWHSLQGKSNLAKQDLTEALGNCSRASIAYYDAKIALDQMQ